MREESVELVSDAFNIYSILTYNGYIGTPFLSVTPHTITQNAGG